ncbi:prolyl 4-hydroxylase 2-like [Haliotis rufescens]|uniref:prolyl 4-hydroxylase 2-like n=1 Tax=Haliotis rufescens TaxID=6454 RepID=UPI00201F3E0C|nr:prolyl 4-hydroxylase 2-like [Haliotis rufescens]
MSSVAVTTLSLLVACVLTKTSCQVPTRYCLPNGDVVPDVDALNASYKCAELNPRDYILPRIDPGQVGDTTEIRLVPGRTHRRITTGVLPPLFQVPEFLTPEECAYLIDLAKRHGVAPATMTGKNGTIIKKTGGRTRTGYTSFIRADSDPVLYNIQQRISMLTEMPFDLLEESESFQFGMYPTGGHYHSHYDSSDGQPEDLEKKPCCHQIHLPHTPNRCVLCRYITVLMYLNDVVKGGETAFPLADQLGQSLLEEHIDLSAYCQQSSVVVRPEKGKAIMWYNNIRDPETGWIGPVDRYALHGGCDVIEGQKWISNVWISAPQHNRKYDNSVYAVRWT